MGDTISKECGPLPPRPNVSWPSARQFLVQIGIAVAVLIVWAGLLAVFLRASGSAGPAESGSAATAPAVAAATSTALPAVSGATPDVSATSASASPAPVDPDPTLAPAATAPVTAAPVGAPPDDAALVRFSTDVQPILQRRCVKCHGGEKTEEGLSLKTHAELLQGSYNGAVIVPSRSADSLLIEQIEQGKMPKNEPRLLPAEIRTLTAWVDAGALDN